MIRKAAIPVQRQRPTATCGIDIEISTTAGEDEKV
jgi:hypothetical protein